MSGEGAPLRVSERAAKEAIPENKRGLVLTFVGASWRGAGTGRLRGLWARLCEHCVCECGCVSVRMGEMDGQMDMGCASVRGGGGLRQTLPPLGPRE